MKSIQNATGSEEQGNPILKGLWDISFIDAYKTGEKTKIDRI